MNIKIENNFGLRVHGKELWAQRPTPLEKPPEGPDDYEPIRLAKFADEKDAQRVCKVLKSLAEANIDNPAALKPFVEAVEELSPPGRYTEDGALSVDALLEQIAKVVRKCRALKGEEDGDE